MKSSIAVIILFHTFLQCMKEVPLVLELVARHVICIDHNTICALSLVNQNLNEIARGSSEQRKQFLEPYITSHSNSRTKCWNNSFLKWHLLGSAATFMNFESAITDPNPYDFNSYAKNSEVETCEALHLYYAQLAMNINVTLYKEPVLWCADRFGSGYGWDVGTATIFKTRGSLKKPLYEREDKHVCVPFSICVTVPCFAVCGEVYVYAYYEQYAAYENYNLEYFVEDKNLLQHAINVFGKSKSRSCYFNYNGQKYPLRWLRNTNLLEAFTRSKQVEKTETDITFYADGALIDGKPLIEDHLLKIEQIIERGTNPQAKKQTVWVKF